MKNLFNTLKRTLTAAILAAVLLFAQTPLPAHAAVTDYQKAQVSFTFDDGFTGVYTIAAPILQAAGFKGTMYYITGIGDKTYQNGTTDDDQPGLTWTQIQALQNTYGWEIGSHTVDHGLLSTYTAAQVDADLANANAALQAHGITPTTFAFPEGDYLNPTLVETVKYYQAARGFQDVGLNTFPYSDTVLVDESLDNQMTLAQAEALVDQAIANKQWLIFTGHGIGTAHNGYAYNWTQANFQALVTYVKNKNVPVVKVGDAVKQPGVNIVQNSSFEAASTLTNWTTDSATNVALDTKTNGSYPSPTNSVKFTGSTTGSHLFSSNMNVTFGRDYLLNAYVNALNLTTGTIGFYMDEYDAAGNWISGQNLGTVAAKTVGFFNKVLQASSNLVSAFRIQVLTSASSTGTAYVDNVNLYDMAATSAPTGTPTVTPTPTATVSGTPTPTVAPTGTPAAGNILTNGTFDNGLAGWNTTDNTHITAANGVVTMTGNAAQMYLYQQVANFDNAGTYLVSANFDTTKLTSGQLGYYVDEYDANGKYISNQFWGFMQGTSNTISRIYTASSNLVKAIRVHVFLTPGSAGTATVDNVSLVNQGSANVTPTPTVAPTGTPTVGNIVTNGNFDNGLANWNTTDNTHITAANGVVTMTGNAAQMYLYQNIANFDNAGQYLVQANFDTSKLTSGQLGYYVDEYDANGKYLSNQFWGFMQGTTNTISRIYTASSNLVKDIRVHVFLTPGSAGTATVDNISIANQNGATVTPTVAPTATPTSVPSVTPTATPSGTPSVTPTPSVTVTPTPVANNLVTNNSFETVTNGFADSWTRDTNDFVVDTNSKGNAGTNSLHIAANSVLAHAFSTMITIDPTKTYTWSQFVTALTGTGEFGFYIDEYDAAGNWVSGQWKGMINGAFTGTQTFTYTPTSASVSKVRLQYYTTPNSTFDLYIDSVSLSN